MDKFDKKAEIAVHDSPQPTLRELFNEIETRIRTLHAHRHPKQLPQNSHLAAERFIKLINFKPTPFERPTKGENSTVWVWPFRDRVLLLLEKYINSHDLLRDTIDSAVLVGVDWRGDDYIELVNVINEHELMNKIGVKEYRKQAIKKMKSLNFK